MRPLHVSGVHQPGRALAEPRRPLTPILEALGPPSAAPGRVVGVRSDRLDPYYRLLDAGQPVEVFDPRWPLERWPAWVIGNQRLMKLEGRDQGSGGPYRLVTLDRRGGLGLYVRE